MQTFEPWTIERVIENLESLPSYEQQDVFNDLAHQKTELSQALTKAIKNTEGLATLNCAIILLKLQAKAGRDVFLQMFSSLDEERASHALSALSSELAPQDSHSISKFSYQTKIPLTGKEIFNAIQHLLLEPESVLGSAALFVCLKHNIEASYSITLLC
ncbi:hypothetical protein MNBD_GAMMA12-960 [hydrothermal vent metagenome]|uniref:Uncharacterized protein n=1 Tax=hydrothermal vent metagenome TaxID=652676 RepID=A0A3B0YLS5_9ZZZZ